MNMLELEALNRGELRWYVPTQGALEGAGAGLAPPAPLPGRFWSVTTILGQIYRKIEWRWTEDQWRAEQSREYYRERGRMIHKACWLIASGQGVKRSSLDPDYRRAVLQFEDFLRRTQAEVLDSETIVYSRRWGIAGRRDLKARIGSGRRGRHVWNIDLKSGQEDRLVGLQTYAYRALELEMLEGKDAQPERRGALYLSNDKWWFKPCEDPADRRHWQNAVAAFKSAEELGLLRGAEAA